MPLEARGPRPQQPHTCSALRPPSFPAPSHTPAGQFYTGLALAQAMPGPLFNFAAYLGAVIAQNAGVNAIIGASSR